MSSATSILLVEDEDPVRTLARMILEDAGYEIFEAESGLDAMNMWRHCADAVDLVLTDVRMPKGVSGLELAKWLREQKPALKVILCSGYAAEATQDDLSILTGGNFLPKPFPAAALLEKVRTCLAPA